MVMVGPADEEETRQEGRRGGETGGKERMTAHRVNIPPVERAVLKQHVEALLQHRELVDLDMHSLKSDGSGGAEALELKQGVSEGRQVGVWAWGQSPYAIRLCTRHWTAYSRPARKRSKRRGGIGMRRW
jgi:hypothetical protein